MLQDEVSELAVELIARYQPVATDLRFIKSCMEVAYGFSRFGRYAFDISEVLRYLERIADHAEYVGDSVVYTVTGERVPKL